MLELQTIREDSKAVIKALEKRNFEATTLIESVLQLDADRRKIQTELDESLARSNKLSKEIGNLFKTGKREEAEKLKNETTGLKEKSKGLQEKLQQVADHLQEVLWQIPNTPHEKVAAGSTEEDNVEVFRHQVNDKEGPKIPHWELAKEFDLIDFEAGVVLTGAGFPVYKGKGARLQRAMINFFLDRAIAEGYQERQVPHLVNEDSGYGTGQLPDKEGQMYHVGADNLYLIPTAEVPLTNLLRDTIVKPDEFPFLFTSYSPCFRREAGSYGSHVRGLNRLHQFDKVEIVRIEHPNDSYDALYKMVEHVKALLFDLGLTFRILRLCGGDMGFTAAITYDFEVWSPAQDRWLEVSSVSNCETYQANRLKLRFKDENGQNQLAHTLNGSALALPRILAAILENGHQGDSISIPEVLVPYCGFESIDQ